MPKSTKMDLVYRVLTGERKESLMASLKDILISVLNGVLRPAPAPVPIPVRVDPPRRRR